MRALIASLLLVAATALTGCNSGATPDRVWVTTETATVTKTETATATETATVTEYPDYPAPAEPTETTPETTPEEAPAA